MPKAIGLEFHLQSKLKLCFKNSQSDVRAAAEEAAFLGQRGERAEEAGHMQRAIRAACADVMTMRMSLAAVTKIIQGGR